MPPAPRHGSTLSANCQDPVDRKCRLCQSDEVEHAYHLVSWCSAYEDLRQECVAQLARLVTEDTPQDFRFAVRDADPVLFLSDKFIRKLDPELQGHVDAVICNYLKVLWRRREQLWAAHCVPGNPWRLR